jgi:Protein of unknown function (DUF3995)
MTRAPLYTTAAALAAIAGVHIAWGRGSTFPFATGDALADAVVGSSAVPSSAACFGVAAALALASGLVAGAPVVPRRLHRLGVATVTGVLAVRGFAGLAGRTDLLSPGSASDRFRELDRRFYAPLCLALAAGAGTALR